MTSPVVGLTVGSGSAGPGAGVSRWPELATCASVLTVLALTPTMGAMARRLCRGRDRARRRRLVWRLNS